MCATKFKPISLWRQPLTTSRNDQEGTLQNKRKKKKKRKKERFFKMWQQRPLYIFAFKIISVQVTKINVCKIML